jgi:hypothetical protein
VPDSSLFRDAALWEALGAVKKGRWLPLSTGILRQRIEVMPMDPTSRSRARLVRAGRHAAAFLIPALLAIGAVGQAADIVWVGNDAFNNSNFSASGNWQNNTLPTWSSSNSLIFTQNQNANVTGLVYDLSGFQPVNDIFWASTFPVARTLSASDTSNRGIDFRVRLENLSSHTQTVTLNTSGGKFAAPEIHSTPSRRA